jgi:hypothetical protein
MKLDKVIPKTVKIRLPAIAKAKSKTVDVIMTLFESCVLFVLSIFCVSAMYIGTIPTGFKTTSNAMVDLSMCRTKSSGIKCRSIIFNISHICRRILFYYVLAQTIQITQVAEKHAGKSRRVLRDIDISSKENAHSL